MYPVNENYQPKSKKNFFFGKKKKPKPVCTCHLRYPVPGISGGQFDPRLAAPVGYQGPPGAHYGTIESSQMCFAQDIVTHQQQQYSMAQMTPTMHPNSSYGQLIEQQQYQQQQQQHKYQKHNFVSNCDTYGANLQYPNSAHYSPDVNLQRRFMNPELAMEVSHRQRRWSDGRGPEYQDHIYTPPNGFACECGNCQQYPGYQEYSKSRPRVSFGPMMMYPNETDPMFELNKEKKKSQNKLTTELLPLDTHIPLQMMSDSALVCTIV